MTIRYVDASMPDDTGDGSFGSPKRTPRAAMLSSSSGDKILIKSGYCYDSVNGSFLFFSSISNVEVGTYGTASDKPVFDALTYENPGASGWAYIGSGVWKKTFSNWYIRRLWIASRNSGIRTSERYLGTAMRRAYGPNGLTGATANPTEANIIAGLGSPMIWFGGGSGTSYTLYVYTGTASIDPPTYYEGLAFIQSNGTSIGSVAGVHVENQTGIYVHDLHFRGNGGTGIRLQSQNSNARNVANCLFEDCIATAPYQGAFRSAIAAELTPAYRCTSTTVRRMYCDYLSSEYETESVQAYDNLSGVSDNFYIGDGSEGIIVENCVSKDSMHQGLVSGSTGMRTTPPKSCKFIDNTVQFSGWSAYGRGMSNYDGNTAFTGNHIDGQNTRSQFAGSAKVIGNVWTHLGPSKRKASVAEWIACESYVLNLFTGLAGNESYLTVNPVNVVIANNTVYFPWDQAISFNFFTTAIGPADNSFAAGTITIQNNIIYSPRSQFLKTYEDSGKVMGQQVISNNCVFNGATGDQKISWRGTDYSINCAPGSATNWEADPHLDADHRPTNPLLIRAGVTVDGFDFNGKRLYAQPNIGAVDDLTAAPRKVLARAA